MEYSVWKAFLFFFCGVAAHAFAVRIFKVYVKSLFYRMTFINCLAILRFADNLSQNLINSCEGSEAGMTDESFEHWRILALLSLKSYVPDAAWKQISITDWQTAMKLLSELENKGVLDDQI